MCWAPFQNGATIGAQGSENGTILKDDEHELGARVTLEETPNRAYSHAITLGIYGWMVHTCFASNETAARVMFDDLKKAIESVIALIPKDPNADRASLRPAEDAITNLVDRFQ